MDAMTSPAVRTDLPWYNAFVQAADSALCCMEINSARDEPQDLKLCMRPLSSWLRDYRTIRLDCGQRVGKTHWVIHNATDRDLIVRHRGVNYYPDRLPQAWFAGPKGLVGPVELKDGTWLPERVFVDVASLLSREQIEVLYETLGKSEHQTFILLG